MITVYHLAANIDREDQLDIMCMFDLEKIMPLIENKWRGGAYQPVATIDVDSLSAAWRLSNNVEESWIDNPEIVNRYGNERRYGRRSSMVGDIMEKDGELFVVERIGFGKLSFSVSDFMVHVLEN